ncbi:CDP-alcohol phosphatidyltransferase family protein [Halorubrum ezzemoulense]|uniref:CDP-alcohol phosphatidyltransferase family protein n=1 Tax=Halorubrum ezzemoulense TaxID=337243 RepID=A0ABT4YYL1_HALEZ|nr:CDP-alcohol phosphatidyltransferase family protein [Halorubrum ezzemoulense]MDB2245514.1 CDP-alcohol phosphatidyltransferase family protein [Halorubrum ezzemoulense]MDB2250400.1 CDP-alcohol phosphatidyltransferase family protein [Halorubrum ezzemoulense]MDB2279108.1 CDP-alcohol phosphatidyltransferase family protein [Halorubrum ezzemoulense]MDB2285656.1 CDP-alcohol phosphatidyltransferase family protein [Halorubrum ezzemoulense]MDB2287470.1 CDP-alcohol phosphatidyltransferase family protein
MAEPAPSTASPRSRLRLRFAGAVTLGALGLAALWRTFGTAWVLAAAGPGAYLAAYAWTHLGANHRPGVDGPRPRLGPANVITLFRGWLASVLAGALAAAPPHPWIPAALFAGAVSLDAVDGAVARRTRETILGARLDGATDALAVLVGAAVAVALGALPAWYLLAGGVWYAYAGSLWWRRRTGALVYELPPSRVRPFVGTAQFAAVAVALVPGVGGARVASPLAAFAGVALAALLASFARDWAAATGRLGRDDPPTANRE